jgi:hypothetical protein
VLDVTRCITGCHLTHHTRVCDVVDDVESIDVCSFHTVIVLQLLGGHGAYLVRRAGPDASCSPRHEIQLNPSGILKSTILRHSNLKTRDI